MTAYLLDTNVVSAARRLTRQELPFQAFMTAIRLDDTFISALTITEIGFGIQQQRRRDAAFARDLDRWLAEIVLPRWQGRILPFDEAAAKACATLPTPELRPTVDAMIGAVAMTRGLVVATRNVGDFQPLGVPVHDPWTGTPQPSRSAAR